MNISNIWECIDIDSNELSDITLSYLPLYELIALDKMHYFKGKAVLNKDSVAEKEILDIISEMDIHEIRYVRIVNN